MTIAPPVTPDQIPGKLALIAKLDAAELRGWHRYCTGWREPFAGEIAALLDRARVLKTPLPSSASGKP